MASDNALDQRRDTRGFGPLIFPVFEIEIVHHFAHRSKLCVIGRHQPRQHFESAEVPLMRELAFEHVEADFVTGVFVVLRVDKPELRRRIDEPPDQPGRRHAVNLHSPARHPGATFVLGRRA
jgi:hypothetical protein